MYPYIRRLLIVLAVGLSVYACDGGDSPPFNRPPTVYAGPDQSVDESVTIQLAGMGFDPEGGTVTYNWTQFRGPPVRFSSTTEPDATVEIPEVPIGSSDSVVLSLRVTDRQGPSNTDIVKINVASTDYVVFKAYQDAVRLSELYKYDPETDTLLKLSGTMVSGGGVTFFEISPDGQWVAYVADQDTDGIRELYVAAADGSGFNKINDAVPPLGGVRNFAWSPDGTQVAFIADTVAGSALGVFLAEPDGENHREISGPVGEPADVPIANVRWSPDGRYLALGVRSATSPSRVSDIFCYDTQSEGLDSVRLSPPSVNGSQITNDYAWSPDSSRIAYRVAEEPDNVLQLYTVRPDGTDNLRLNPLLAATRDVRSFAWSPDSLWILYLADQDTDETDEIYTVHPDGSENLKVNGPLVSKGDVIEFSWSPDSSRISYLADQDIDGVEEIYTVRPDASENVKVSGTLGGSIFVAIFYSWSPDSSRILYSADQDTDGVKELYTVRPDGTANLKVNSRLVANGEVSAGFSWSPDSSSIAYLADQETDGVIELFTVRPDASENRKINGPLHVIHDITDYTWSPDSSRILYQAERTVLELYLSTPDGLSRLNVSGAMDTGRGTLAFAWST